MKKPYKTALFLTLAVLLCTGAVWGASALLRAKPAARVSAAGASAGASAGGSSSGGAGSDILNLLPSSSQCFASTSSASSSSSSAAQTNSFELIPDFFSASVGYVEVNRDFTNGAVSQYLLYTEDGGKTWGLRSRENSSRLSQLSFVSAQVGYEARVSASGAYTLVKATDGGAAWKPVSTLPQLPISDLHTVGKSTVYVESSSDTGASRLLRSSDGGTWADVALPAWPKSNLPGARMQISSSWVSPSQGYLLELGGGGMGSTEKALFATDNGGRSWTLRADALFNDASGGRADSLPLSGAAVLSAFFPDGTGYLPNAGGLVRTSDGGGHFMTIFGGNYGFPVLSNACFYSASGGFAVLGQENGETDLSRTSDGGRTWKTVVTLAELAKLPGLR